MKFQLVIEPDGKRLILLPENQGEQQILQAVTGDQPTSGNVSGNTMARVEAEWSSDRVPYKKLLKLRIKFGETSDHE